MRRSFLKMGMILMTAALVGCSEKTEDTATQVEKLNYTNPISLADEWEDYGIGDPYILKFNGTYYLYSSTRDTDTGIKVWRSRDLVDWTYEGITADIAETQAAYAPEVIYWNGSFYMYTSPAGNGHYVLKSDSPTGPFELVTDNMGKSIDGSVFVDDDGKMYFSHAGVDGIEVAKMEIPTVMGPSVVSGAYMDGWTEGSTIFKRNGKYYMTYTGNHVFSKGYRIDYAVSDSPTEGFVPASQNPLLISTTGATVGLGHNSIFRGPDLDTDYIVYHNLEGAGVVGPLRHMDLDRLTWNGPDLEVFGPTTTTQEGADRPKFEDFFDEAKLDSTWEKKKGRWKIAAGFLEQKSKSAKQAMLLSEDKSSAAYTAEFHVKAAESSDEGLLGAVFSYQDDKNYGLAVIDQATNSFQTRFTIAGVDEKWETSELPEDFDASKLHEIRVEKALDGFRFYIDGMQKQVRTADLAGGAIGYLTEKTAASFRRGIIGTKSEPGIKSCGGADSFGCPPCFFMRRGLYWLLERRWRRQEYRPLRWPPPRPARPPALPLAPQACPSGRCPGSKSRCPARQCGNISATFLPPRSSQ